MNKRIHRVFSMVLVLAMVATLAVSAFATVKASDRFVSTRCEAFAIGSGQVLFEFDLNATDYMDEIGFKRILIYEQQSNGTYKCIETLSEKDHGFLFTNDWFAAGNYTYQGTSGVKYYANIQFYCKSDGVGESIYRNTNVVTA